MTGHGQNIIAHERDGVLVVAFTRPDVIDQVYIRHTGDEIYALLKDLDPPHCVVDFERVRYLSSAALGMIIALYKVVTKRGGLLRLASVQREVQGVFKLTKLPKLVPCVADVATALQEIRAEAGGTSGA